MKKNTVLLLPIIFLGGCGLIPNRHAPEKMIINEIPEGNGLVIIATGADSSCISEASLLKVMRAGHKYDDNEQDLIDVDGFGIASDFETHHGYLNVLSLKAGDYYLANWIANPYVKAVKIPRYSFTVTSSKTTYLGEYYLTQSCSNRSVIAEFRNMRQRDMELLRNRNFMVPEIDIDSNIPKFSGYAVE